MLLTYGNTVGQSFSAKVIYIFGRPLQKSSEGIHFMYNSWPLHCNIAVN